MYICIYIRIDIYPCYGNLNYMSALTAAQEKKDAADPEEHGRIHGRNLMDLARKIMSASLDKEVEAEKGEV